MENKPHYTIVGIFVIVLSAAITFCIIWLSSGFSFEQYTTYKVYMKESISGLSVDAPVEYNGVNVGSVSSIELDSRNPQIVELLVRIKDSTPITRGTTATLSTRGLTGMVYIALKDDSSDLRKVAIQAGEDYPVIKTGPSIFLRIDTALSGLTANLEKVTKSIQSILTPENQHAIKLTLVHLEKFTNMLEQNNNKFDAILNNLSQATDRLNPILKSSQRTLKLIEMQTLPVTYEAIRNIENITSKLSDIVNQLKQNPTILLRGQTQNLGPGEVK